MEIVFKINEEEFSNKNKESLQKSWGIDKDQLPTSLNSIAKSALSEYLSMISDGGMPNRADEAKQGRLLHIITNYYKTVLPTEAQLSEIFQITESQSRALLKNTVSRFRNKLETIIKKTLIEVIDNAEKNNHSYLIIIESDVVKEELNKIITKHKPKYKLVSKRKNSAKQFEVSEDSYDLLKKDLKKGFQ